MTKNPIFMIVIVLFVYLFVFTFSPSIYKKISVIL